jgi:PBSX family phage terminase large subunit
MGIEWQFSEKQLRSIFDSNARINLWEGAVRSGKTVGSIIRWLEYIKKGPAGSLAMIGKTERTLKNNILDEIAPIVGSKNYEPRYGDGYVKIFGRKILLYGANDERSESKIRGKTLAGAYGDEITLWPESFFRQLMLRLSVKGSKFFGTTNPDSPYHWLKAEYIDKVDEGDLDMKVFHFNLDDNPALDPDYVRSLKKEYTGLWYKRFILGAWVQAAGAVYDMWDEDEHTFRDVALPAGISWEVWCDYGTHNPCVFLLVARKGERFWIMREYYWNSRETNRQKTDQEYRTDLVEFVGDRRIDKLVIDPSAASFIQELQKNTRFPIVKANNDVEDGIRVVSSALTAKRLLVHEDCKNTIREFGSYVWDEKAQKRGEDKPVKEMDHSMDAVRYGVNTRSAANVRFIDAGEKTADFEDWKEQRLRWLFEDDDD